MEEKEKLKPHHPEPEAVRALYAAANLSKWKLSLPGIQNYSRGSSATGAGSG